MRLFAGLCQLGAFVARFSDRFAQTIVANKPSDIPYEILGGPSVTRRRWDRQSLSEWRADAAMLCGSPEGPSFVNETMDVAIYLVVFAVTHGRPQKNPKSGRAIALMAAMVSADKEGSAENAGISGSSSPSAGNNLSGMPRE
jgi:hypothetical protein